MSFYPIQPSFAAGELTPSLWGRVDLAKYNVGLKRCENFVIHPHGGLSRRQGMRFIARARGACRLVPFIYNSADSYVLEFSDRRIRFFKAGVPVLKDGSVYEIETPYTSAQLRGLTFAQSADVLFIVHPERPPMELARYSDTYWTLTECVFSGGPFRTQSERMSSIMLTPGAIRGTTTLHAGAALFNQSYVGTLIELVQHADEQYVKETRDAAAHNDIKTIVYTDVKYAFEPVGTHYVEEGENSSNGPHWAVTHKRCFQVTPAERAALEVGDGVSYGGKTGTIVKIRYVQNKNAYNLLPSFDIPHYDGENHTVTFTTTRWVEGADHWGPQVTAYKGWRVETNGFWSGTIKLQRFDVGEGRWVTIKDYTSPRSKTAGKNFQDSGDFDEPTQLRLVSSDFASWVPPDNEEVDRGYVVLAADEAETSGWGRITAVASSTAATIAIEKDFAATTGTLLWREGAWSSRYGYPSAVGFYQERLCLGGSIAEPQTVWMSKTGDYYNFGTSSPTVDDDAITATLAARQVNPVRHFIGLDRLIVLTGGSEWLISADGAVTPTDIQAKPQGYRGSSLLEPIVVGNMILFVQQQGRRVRDLGYSYESDGYTGNDLSVMADHLTRGHIITDWAFQQEPDSLVWIVRDDGRLFSLTYLREHDVYAWGRHPTQGTVESVAAIPGAAGDDVYFCVVRNGVRCIEAIRPEETDDVADSFFLDSGVTVASAAGTDTVTGLGHLEGQTVDVLADGSFVGGFTVSAGRVKLPHAAKKIHAGLGYRSKLHTLDISTQRQDGTSVTRKARVVSVAIRVERTRGLWAGVDEEHLAECADRTGEAYGAPTRLFNGDIPLTLDSGYTRENAGSVWVETKAPLPASILAIVPEVSFGG